MRGDRRTFIGETSIRVVEQRLGIERDKTLTYKTTYNRNFSSGYYNNSQVRGGYGDQNIGRPYKREAEVPTYQLGRQSQSQHKRVKTNEDGYNRQDRPTGYGRPGGYDRPTSYDPFNPHGNSYSGPPPTAPPMMNYQPRVPTNYYPPQHYGRGDGYAGRGGYGQMPSRGPGEEVTVRPPSLNQHSNFGSQRPDQRPGYPSYGHQDSQTKEKDRSEKKPQNRFENFKE